MTEINLSKNIYAKKHHHDLEKGVEGHGSRQKDAGGDDSDADVFDAGDDCRDVQVYGQDNERSGKANRENCFVWRGKFFAVGRDDKVARTTENNKH